MISLGFFFLIFAFLCYRQIVTACNTCNIYRYKFAENDSRAALRCPEVIPSISLPCLSRWLRVGGSALTLPFEPTRSHSLAVVLLSPKAKKIPAEAGKIYRYKLKARHGRFVERDYISKAMANIFPFCVQVTIKIPFFAEIICESL